MSNELYHFGTKGQKWGVRNYQNADGTFNDAGKKRYFGTKSTRKSAKDLSNDELRTAIKRKNLENDYVRFKSKKANSTADSVIKGLNVAGNISSTSARISKAAGKSTDAANMITTATNSSSNIVKNTKNFIKTNKLDVSKMSDKELSDIVERMRLEEQYNNAYGIKSGAEHVGDILDKVGAAVGIAGSAVAIAVGISTAYKKLGGSSPVAKAGSKIIGDVIDGEFIPRR